MTAVITMADALHITDDQPITQPLIDFHNIVLNIRWPKLSNGKTWLALDSQSYEYFCSRGKIARGNAGPSIFSYDYLAMPIFGGLLGLAFEKEHGKRTIEEMKARLGRFKPHVMEAWQMPLQQNLFDCGIFVCQYIHALVEACFEGAENGVRFSMSPLAYRRGLRDDVCALAEGRLIGELTAAGHEIPCGNEIRKPPEVDVIGDEVEDREWRAEMAERMHRLEVRNESQAVAIAKLERQLRELMLHRPPHHGVDSAAVGEGHGDVAPDGGPGAPAPVVVMGGDNGGKHDSIGGAHGEGPVADVETGAVNVSVREGGVEGDTPVGARSDNGKARVHDAGAGGMMGTTDGNRGAGEAVGAGHGVTASNVNVVPAHSAGTETTSRNTTRGRAPSSGYTGISKREGKWAARLCIDSANNKFLALGRYTEILDAATAYAAAAHICRPSISSSKMVELSEEDRRCLEGLSSIGVERIVEAKRWPEWRNWRVVLSSLPEPSTPAPAGVHTQAPPPFSHQHPRPTFGNYHTPAAAFVGQASASLNHGGWQPYTQSNHLSNLHFPSQQYAFNHIPIHPFSQVQEPMSVPPAGSVPNPAGHVATQNTAPHPHALPTTPAVAPSTAHPQVQQVPPLEQTAQARVAGMTDSQHSLSMTAAPNNPNPPSHGSTLANEAATGEMSGAVRVVHNQSLLFS
ncbi:unnamed protein product [Closterium sp. NIES-65]|nr:unnamed protein product [Closterium sp. NIES-65]